MPRLAVIQLERAWLAPKHPRQNRDVLLFPPELEQHLRSTS